MDILLVNDDGVYAKGILTLAKYLSKSHNVVVVAPHSQMSGKSHSMTFHDYVNVIKLDIAEGIDFYALSGTPADCVKFGIEVILKHNPDLVVSGINNGFNLGTDVAYSGTVGACMESGLMGVPSIAISQNYHLTNFDFSASFLCEKLDELYSIIKDTNKILSINLPYDNAQDTKGVRFAKVGVHQYTDNYIDCGIDGFMLTGEPIEDIENDDDADVKYIRQGYITISPIKPDFTDNQTYNMLKGIKL